MKEFTAGVIMGGVLLTVIYGEAGVFANYRVTYTLSQSCLDAGFTDEHCRNLLEETHSDWFDKLSK